MSIQNRHIRALRPFLIGERPKSNGEWDMFCPLHEDNKRSASLNVISGQWYCFASCGGGGIVDLIRRRSEWVSREVAAQNGRGRIDTTPAPEGPAEVITEAKISGWHSGLMANDSVLEELLVRRGLHTDTIVKFEIGYDQDKRVYTIPVRGPEGEIWNVRRYNMNAAADRRKIWSVRGMRVCELYPISVLADAERVIIPEGEWDTLLTIQNGYAAVTRTASATTWQGRWDELFRDRVVFIGQDCDKDGQVGARKIGRHLHRIAADVRVIQLPYPVVDKHGKDLTDFWQEFDRADFERLLAEAPPFKRNRTKQDPEVVTVLDSFDSHKVGHSVKLQVTIKGKKEPGYSVPQRVRMTCSRDAGSICQICPMNGAGGDVVHEVNPTNPVILQMMDATSNQLHEIVRQDYGAMKCKRLVTEVEQHQAVEVLFARPSIDHADGTKARDYKNVKITSAGRYDTMPNNTVIVTGALYPNPRNQLNEFLAWSIERQETSVDRFELTDEAVALMRRFQVRGRQRPMRKLAEIERELASCVTRIIGRPEMHAVMDLTFHGALSFKFGGQVVHRGWIESLVVGDTRTGKSEAAERLVRHYGAGEIVGGEAATLAGLVGGLQQIGGKDWAVTWGVVPINDKRIVVIDELSGLHPEEIAKMSDVRASGVARLTKIQQEVTLARTRLLWLGNPRHGGMDQFTYGVDALKPLIGNPEDIARFDLAMAVSLTDVPSADINKRHEFGGECRYTSTVCNRLLMWVWTRQPDQIVWAPRAEEMVYTLANEMGGRYVEDPPLVQAANIRIKIARVSVALAARLFSTDDSHECIVVRPEHVEDAVKFMDRIYRMPAFGYAERSSERISDINEALERREDIRIYLLERRGLAKFLRNVPRFRRQDLEEIMNLDRDHANAIINHLWEARMVRKDGSDVRVEPVLHSLLREVRW